MHIGYGDEKLASYFMPILKVKAKPGIPSLPDTPNQPNSYSSPKNHLARKLKWNVPSGSSVVSYFAIASYILIKWIISLPGQLARDLKRKEKKLKAPNVETAFVSDFSTF